MMEHTCPLNRPNADDPSQDDVVLLSVAQKAALFKSKMVVDEGIINEMKVISVAIRVGGVVVMLYAVQLGEGGSCFSKK